LRVCLQETQIRPVGRVGGDQRHVEVRADLTVGLIECPATPDNQKLEVAARQTLAQTCTRLDDDLWSDAGGITHRDCQMSFGHYFSYPCVTGVSREFKICSRELR